MRRIYYLTRSLGSVQGISEDLHEAGIGDNRIFVMGDNRGVLEQAHLHTTSFWEDTDILHSGFVGSVWGLIAGVVAGFLLAGMDPWGMDLGLGAILAASLFGLCLGAWVGGIRGIQLRNPHLLPYLSHLRGDQYLVMVDADDERMTRQVERVMREQHAEAREAGREENYSPFFMAH
ncbi:MAG: hypothetical protein P1U64_03110 [Alcanivoracaceae bacterium]|jgi:hypothetical protein|nr:hypothetical protein [Alcanivoracaceae bacterium]